MARLWIFSDLHQDWADNAWDPTTHAPAFDVAVVAGDVDSPLTRAIDWLADRLGGSQILYVPGNHDFWWNGADDRYTLADQLARGRDLAARRGVTVCARRTRSEPTWRRSDDDRSAPSTLWRTIAGGVGRWSRPTGSTLWPAAPF